MDDLAETPWGALLLADARRQAAFCRDRLAAALALCRGDELLQANYAPSLEAALDGLEGLLAAESWDEAAACLPIPFPAAGRKKKRTPESAPWRRSGPSGTGSG